MSFGITVKTTNLLSAKVQLEPFVVNAIKKRKWSFKTPRSGIFLEISYPQPSPTPPICFFSGIYLLLINTRSQINAALLSTASMDIYIEISTTPLNAGLIRIITIPRL